MIAVNKWVVVIRDEMPEELLYIPPESRIKPHCGTILSVGDCVESPRLKAAEGKKCLWHPTVGQEIEYEDKIYVLLEGGQVICFP
jgi:co-chaperonin GroES (HSP10)